MALPSSHAKPRGKQFGKSFGKLGVGGPPVAAPPAIAPGSSEATPSSLVPSSNNNNNNNAAVVVDGVGTDATKTRERRNLVRQASLFTDLDKAEGLALDLLALASSTARSLADVVGSVGSSAHASNKQIRSNGKDYLEKVSAIHALLEPHAHVVVAYKNHGVDVDVDVDKRGNERERDDDDDDDEHAATPTKQKSDDGASKNQRSDSVVHNMYAARVECRLALERRDVLNEYLRLEKVAQRSQQETKSTVDEHEQSYADGTSSMKRKRL